MLLLQKLPNDMSHYFYSLVLGSQKARILAVLVLNDFQAFVNDEVKASDRCLVSVEQAFYVDDGKCVVNESALEPAVKVCVGGHRGSAVDFDEPGFEVCVDHEVVAVEFEGVFAGEDALLDGL